MISIQKVDATFIPAIRQLALHIWPTTYKEILSAEQLSYMLDLLYSDNALQKQIASGHEFIIVDENKVAIGFASYSSKSEEEPFVYRLHKIYIDPDQQGKGIGKILLNYIINDVQSKNATHLELNVNRYNKALHFYQKNGFEIIREEDIDIGNGYFMNDYVMQKKL
jgi:diamine N-acetyltransferase